MQLVVVMAVTKAVRAATMTFTTISMMCFFLSFISLGFKDFRFGISDFRFWHAESSELYEARGDVGAMPREGLPLAPSQRGKRKATLGQSQTDSGPAGQTPVGFPL